MTDMKRERKPFPFWLVCVLVLLCTPFIGGFGGSLVVRVIKGGRTWKELPSPSGEKVVAILDATITTDKEHRLCVRTERGSVYLWRKRYQSWGRLDPDGPLPDQYWHLLKTLPDKQAIRYLVISDFISDDQQPLVAVKSESGQAYAWQNDNWHPFERITIHGFDWPRTWPSDGETKPSLIILTNNFIGTNSRLLSSESKPHGEFHPWFVLPRLPGKVIDEANVSFEGSLSDWLSSYLLLENGRLLVLATERDFIDAAFLLAGAAAAFLAGVIVLIILGVRRKRAKARNLEATTC